MTSIIILNYNTPKLTIECIESIKENTEPNSYEIILVDNGSKDDSVQKFQSLTGNISLVVCDKNYGFAGGSNIGIRHSKGDEICLLNSDTIVTENWLTLLKKALYSDKNIGIVGPVTNNAAAQVIATPNLDDKSKIYKFGRKFNSENTNSYENAFSLIFFCVLIKREVYDRIGGLDEKFFPGNYEDDDYSLRARLAGFKLIIANNVFIFHYAHQSFYHTCQSAKDFEETLSRGLERFLKKYNLSSSSMYKKSLETEIYRYKGFIKKDSPRILLVNTGVSLTPFILSKDFKGANIEILTDTFMEALILTPDYSAKWCENIVEPFNDINGKYDVIYCLMETTALKTAFDYCNRLLEYVNNGGILLIYENQELVCKKK